MRKALILVALIAFVSALGLHTVAAVTTSCDPGTYVVSVNSAKVRADSNTSSAQLALVRRNSLVPVAGGLEGARVSGSTLWCAVTMVGDQVGYIHSSLLSIPSGEAPAAAPIPVVSSAPATSSTNVTSNPTSSPVTTVISTPVAPPQVSCPSLSYTCSQLTCSQAYACLNAGNGRLDRDNDGIPCEAVCGG